MTVILSKMKLLTCVYVLFFTVYQVLADTPANCTYEDIKGTWILHEGERKSDSSLNCTEFSGPTPNTLEVDLLFPNVAIDKSGNKGYWTIVYNQGFEVVINYRKYFAFSKYQTDSSGQVVSNCNSVLPGWSHDILGNNWACYTGKKGDSTPQRSSESGKAAESKPKDATFPASVLAHFINRVQKSWTATVYPELENLAIDDLVRRSGGLRSRINSPPSPSAAHDHVLKLSSGLPNEFDWRNVAGINYVSPVRNQGSCGSCYAFSSLAMLEARLRIMTNNSLQVQFSPQDVVSCSEYSQGCEGGFPYVIAGKYAQDFGVVPEDCIPYEGKDDICPAKKCKRYFVAKYNYVGGFFGGCNEDLMKLELVKRGPLTVAFEVYPDFQLYAGGIYHHTGIGARFNPFHLVNHGVLITGYGVDNSSGEKFWTVKNSWGTSWGESGYFRIRRGTNECNIESMAVSAIPIP